MQIAARRLHNQFWASLETHKKNNNALVSWCVRAPICPENCRIVLDSARLMTPRAADLKNYLHFLKEATFTFQQYYVRTLCASRMRLFKRAESFLCNWTMKNTLAARQSHSPGGLKTAKRLTAHATPSAISDPNEILFCRTTWSIISENVVFPHFLAHGIFFAKGAQL